MRRIIQLHGVLLLTTATLLLSSCSSTESAGGHERAEPDHVSREQAVGATCQPVSPSSQETTDPVLSQYLRMHRALASDSVDGVTAAAGGLGRAAEAHRCHGGSHGEVASALVQTASGFEVADLASARERFKTLSQHMIRYREIVPAVAGQTYVVHCSMANADWLQVTEEVSNPYHGSEMPRCGQVTKRHGEV